MVAVREDGTVTSNHAAYVTPATLFELNLLNHTWVSISWIRENKADDGVSVNKHFEIFEDRRNDFVVQLSVHDDFECIDLDGAADSSCDSNFNPINGILYVSPAALFNIMKKNIGDYMKYRTEELKVDILPLSDFDSSNPSFYADFVDISLISCPFGSIELERIDDILKDYFLEPKALCLSEQFKIPLRQVSSRAPLYLFFTVKSCSQSNCKRGIASTNALFVSSQKSKLILSTPLKSFVPRCPCTYKNNKNLLKLFHNTHYREAFEKISSQLYSLLNTLTCKLMASKDLTVLLEGPRGVGKGLMVQSISEKFCMHFHEEHCYDLIGESLTSTEKRIEKLFELIASVGPCVLFLKKVDLLCKDRDGSHEERRILHCFTQQLAKLSVDFPILLVGSTHSVSLMTPRFHSEFLYHFKLECPNEFERLSLIKSVSDGFTVDEEILSDMVKKSSGFVLSDFIALFTRVKYMNAENVDCRSKNLATIMHTIKGETMDRAVEELRISKASGGSGIRIPKVKWDDVGGLHDVKKDILDTIELPLKFPNLFSSGLQRSGLLFYGPPGCGKTLLAKAIATEFTLNFYSVKGPELINMYVGQSEENVRQVFSKARSMTPCIIFFDELDSIAPNRGRSGDSGGVMDRIVSQLLSELDGIHNNTDIFIIGATNRPDLLDSALLRPGRFDKMIYVGVPENRDERLRILKAVTRKLKLAGDVSLDVVADMCPINLTGADFYALASESLMNCYRRLINLHETEGVPLNADDVVVTLNDIQVAFKRLVPSVSVSELQRYKSIREQIISRN